MSDMNEAIYGQHSFVRRHVGTTANDQEHMLKALGVSSLSELMEKAVPSTIYLGEEPDSILPEAATESATLEELRGFAKKNNAKRSLIGLGYYGTHTPSVIQRNILENPGWYTAYTPYQPEISQGRLESLMNFQTMIADLTGMDLSNASMLDEASAAAESMMLARRQNRRQKSNVFLVDADVLPTTRYVLEGRADILGFELKYVDFANDGAPEGDFFGALIQYPGASGRVWDATEVIAELKKSKAVVIVAADLLALTLLKSPGEMGADVVMGTSQRFGVPLGFGGPHAAFVAVNDDLKRQLPGRLVGISKDADGNPAYRLSLQTREQHIRREKATSNITTAQVLLAVMASMYAVYHGPDGLTALARQTADRTATLAAWLKDAGFTLKHEAFFDTLRIEAPGRAKDIYEAFKKAEMLIHVVDDDTVQLSLDETVTAEDLKGIAGVFGEFGSAKGEIEDGAVKSGDAWGGLVRETSFLQHPVFQSFHSETAMMRYLRRLSDRDYGLDRGMIPLGSCTMKLNSATEMAAITWPEFNSVHPFAPVEDVEGYLEMITQLEEWLADLTGYDTVSLQPNAGSQGEVAGLLAIKAYHNSRGESQRDVCVVPSSAHGTNAASAAIVGMRVVVVASDANGNIDVDDLKQKIKDHGDELAAIMITYPSTHGVYESEVRTICQLVHDAGGQVYVDGANATALLQVARPGEFGGDVSHLNLHKTFCIPHGGGGPGVGPVAAKAHLAPFLPGHPQIQKPEHPVVGEGEQVHGGAPVSQAPYGSASILPISWAYIRMMGAEGIRHATSSAVLGANYLAKRLSEKFEILYTGENGLVAHECIVDLRPFTARTGITVDDMAKRLIDYGFHAPTMSFPVAGTFMVEPTESEDLQELDRFADAMLAMYDEAEKVLSGEWPKDDNPLVNAPHTAECASASEWEHPYSREVAVYPGVDNSEDVKGYHSNRAMRIQAKYWPVVRRIEQAFGDRNLVPTWGDFSGIVDGE
ncbi:aminomethyl-transferring glycine dehydrogenase [Helcobacillus massiliensis]|uniref:aminomethyl-transferring glycine dehydrogenase n=1 Tax=Helcobacillus massiliensis TaxID=521392 RepID=UPI0021A7A719|nr:aminomethyl-transferring glycine dehydrogenase [Helcobacillus massiliensis]MCT1558288.1 aminomethyl-transferring glycine dehydrogenase [Helcobacillus massiliensis]MCT2035473.1 aminomethyl-transferring glycine dehydrogenase [Helcobacillus massiliensis]MCT2332033.1 aminomethyl-transferring glycine dehydrogenase [Helcobacillus massiliensis]